MQTALETLRLTSFAALGWLWPIVLAIAGWIAMEFVARPIRKFFDLRGEIRTQMLEYANVSSRWKSQASEPEVRQAIPISLEEADRLEAAERIYRELATKTRSFGETEYLASWTLRKLFRIDALKAGAALFGLSANISTYGMDRARSIEEVEKTLRIV